MRYKLLGGLAVRRACYGVLRFVMESGELRQLSKVWLLTSANPTPCRVFSHMLLAPSAALAKA